jgi:ribosomal protein S18 acetylase RimI-like enzyme
MADGAGLELIVESNPDPQVSRFLDDIPADMRGQGHGMRIMAAIEQEAVARGCRQMLLETHSFQAPDLYRKLGFRVTGSVAEYPRGHQYLTMLKRL